MVSLSEASAKSLFARQVLFVDNQLSAGGFDVIPGLLEAKLPRFPLCAFSACDDHSCFDASPFFIAKVDLFKPPPIESKASSLMFGFRMMGS